MNHLRIQTQPVQQPKKQCLITSRQQYLFSSFASISALVRLAHLPGFAPCPHGATCGSSSSCCTAWCSSASCWTTWKPSSSRWTTRKPSSSRWTTWNPLSSRWATWCSSSSWTTWKFLPILPF